MYICGTHVFRYLDRPHPWLCVPKDIALAFPNQPRAAVGEVVTKVPPEKQRNFEIWLVPKIGVEPRGGNWVSP